MDTCLTIEKEISLMIDVIDSAIMHGGDPGGAYFSDWFSLETAIGAWIKGRGLEKQYAPNEDSYISKIQRLSLSNAVPSESRYYIVFGDDEFARFKEHGIATPRPGVPFHLVQYIPNQSLMPSFSRRKDKYGFYEIDYRRAEEDKACVFYQYCDEGTMLVADVPVNYLKQIETPLDKVDCLVQKAGFFIEFFDRERLSIRNKRDSNYYISLLADGTVAAPGLKQRISIFTESLSEKTGDSLDICKVIYKLLWEK